MMPTMPPARSQEQLRPGGVGSPPPPSDCCGVRCTVGLKIMGAVVVAAWVLGLTILVVALGDRSCANVTKNRQDRDERRHDLCVEYEATKQLWVVFEGYNFSCAQYVVFDNQNRPPECMCVWKDGPHAEYPGYAGDCDHDKETDPILVIAGFLLTLILPNVLECVLCCMCCRQRKHCCYCCCERCFCDSCCCPTDVSAVQPVPVSMQELYAPKQQYTGPTDI